MNIIKLLFLSETEISNLNVRMLNLLKLEIDCKSKEVINE